MDTRLLRLILPVCWLLISACTQTTPFITMTLSVPTDDMPGAGSSLNDRLAALTTVPVNAPAFERNRCQFTVDYAHSSNVTLKAQGDPGQSGFNVRLSSSSLQQTSSEFPCDANVVPIPSNLDFQPSPLSLGVLQRGGTFTVDTDKGTFGLTGSQPVGLMEFTLTSFDRNRDRSVGDFKFLFPRICLDPNDSACRTDTTWLYGVGSFLMPIH
jgi:hypothetical protein